MKVFKLKKRKDLKNAIGRISLVENPAIELGLVYLSQDKPEQKIFLNEEKRMFYSPVLVPNQKIDRVNNNGEKYQILFDKETIEMARKDYMSALTPLQNWNHEHEPNTILEGIKVVDNWIVKDEVHDLSVALGYKVPVGTWMLGAYVENEEVIKKIKNGTYKGISIEGLFEDFELVEETTNLNTNIMNKIEDKVDQILTKLKSIMPTGKTNLGMVMIDESTSLYTPGEFDENVMVYTNEEMTEPANGTFSANGVKMTINDGVLVSVEREEDEELLRKKEEEMKRSTELAEAQAQATLELNQKIETLSKENLKLKSEIESLKGLNTELAEVKKSVQENTTLLSKVKEAQVNSVTELSSAPSESAFDLLVKKANNLR